MIERRSSQVETKQCKWYNPNHPDADWSGFVLPPQSRKHPSEIPAAMRVQINSTINGTGLCPNENVETLEWTKPRLRVKFDSKSESKSNLEANPERIEKKTTESCKSPTFSLIGGPTPVSDPSSVGSIGWETEAQAAMKQTGTRVRQLTTYGRSIHIRGRKQTIPAFELAASGFQKEEHAEIRKENPYALNNDYDVCATEDIEFKEQRFSSKSRGKNTFDSNLQNNDYIGFRSHKREATKSFLAGLGKQIIDKVEAKPIAISVAPYATEGNLPTDPYMTSSGERRKDLLLENYSIAVPGYTGTQSFSSST